MTTAELLEHLRKQAMQLPKKERLALAHGLQDSVDDDDGDLHPAWTAEIERRVAAVEAGTADALPVDEAFADIRAKLGW
jgi:putative addiction module component (TIGR02574 family)